MPQRKIGKLETKLFSVAQVKVFGQEKGKEAKKQIQHGNKKRVVHTIETTSHIISNYTLALASGIMGIDV